MPRVPPHMSPEHWLHQVLSSKEAQNGGIVKRQVYDVERLVGRQRFLDETRRRGYQVVENGRHFVVFCNAAPIRRVG